jgi:hypothetical protein
MKGEGKPKQASQSRQAKANKVAYQGSAKKVEKFRGKS